MGNFLSCETSQGLMDIYISSPHTEEKLPVVLVFQEIFGVNHHIRSVCDRLAQEGFVAVAPELFHRDGRRIEISYGDKETSREHLKRLTNETILQDVYDTINFLSVLPTADTTNINTVGFCVGGFSSILTATRFPIQKAVSFYGSGQVRAREGIHLRPIINEYKSIQGECLFLNGELDSSFPSTDRSAIEQKLNAESIPFRMVVYPNSDHGFFCNERKSYNQEDAAKAWKEMITFLRMDTENLRISDFMLSSNDGTNKRPRDSSQSH